MIGSMNWAMVACVGVPVLVVVWSIWTFNRLVLRKTLVAEGWSNIDVQLRRRRSLIPNLVEVVKGYSGYEKRVLENVTRLRGEGEKARTVGEHQASENELTEQVKQLLLLVERYPEIKADKNFLGLQEQLSEIEDQIQMARRYYNGAVRVYNIQAARFPSNLVAKLFGYRSAEFFQIESATQRVAPAVELGK